MTTIPHRCLLALPLLAALAACSGNGTIDGGAAAPAAAAPPTGDWQLMQLDNRATTGATLSFLPDGGAGGNGGCNRYSAQPRFGDRDALQFGPVAATKMACLEDGRMQLESRFFQILEATRSWQYGPAGQLQLLGEGHEILAEFQPDAGGD